MFTLINMVELTFASKDDLAYVFVHAILRKISVAHVIFFFLFRNRSKVWSEL
jgi:hypothetical protein